MPIHRGPCAPRSLRRLGGIVAGVCVLVLSVAAGAESAAPLATPRALSINGEAFHNPAVNSIFLISGTGPAGEAISLHFHRAGMAAKDYSIVRTVTADATGFWQKGIAPVGDYRYYATAGDQTTTSVLIQLDPGVDGAAVRTVARGSLQLLTGTAIPATEVFLHVHAAGTAPNDHNTIFVLPVAGNGTWSWPYRTRSDLLLYVSRDSGDLTEVMTYLVRAT